MISFVAGIISLCMLQNRLKQKAARVRSWIVFTQHSVAPGGLKHRSEWKDLLTWVQSQTAHGPKKYVCIGKLNVPGLWDQLAWSSLPLCWQTLSLSKPVGRLQIETGHIHFRKQSSHLVVSSCFSVQAHLNLLVWTQPICLTWSSWRILILYFHATVFSKANEWKTALS